MSSYPVLVLPDFTQTFILECDASREGVGAVLYPIYDKEMLAIMHALAKFRQYLVGNEFRVRTDHNSLWFFLEQRQLQERQKKCVSKIHNYDFEIDYVKGKHNVVADALSRRPVSLSLMSIEAD